MEFMSRGMRAVSGEEAPQGTHKKSKNGKGARALTFVLLVGIALLISALCLYLIFGGSKSENSYVKGKKFQAVFLNGGQVYFGKIRNLNNKYITMDNIYYLRVNQQVQPNQTNNSSAAQDISLAKLGCELHGPEDTMVINREQVTFWENLKDDGQVVQAINKYVQQNPNGQKCDAAAASSTTPTTPTTTPTTPTTPTPTPTTPTTKKP